MIRRKAKKETLDEPPLKKQKIDESCDDCVYRGSSASLRILMNIVQSIVIIHLVLWMMLYGII